MKKLLVLGIALLLAGAWGAHLSAQHESSENTITSSLFRAYHMADVWELSSVDTVVITEDAGVVWDTTVIVPSFCIEPYKSFSVIMITTAQTGDSLIGDGRDTLFYEALHSYDDSYWTLLETVTFNDTVVALNGATPAFLNSPASGTYAQPLSNYLKVLAVYHTVAVYSDTSDFDTNTVSHKVILNLKK